MDGLIMAGQLLLGLTILVGLHEFGHFITARMFKIRVEKFYIFFDFLFPVSTLLNFSIFKIKKGDTEYGLGWFPLGGYVKIAGMVDESMDEEQMKQPMQDWEFRAKPAWQRLIVMLGGIIMNVITGFVIFIALTFTKGDTYIPAKNAEFGIVSREIGDKIGLKTGDKIININGKPYTRFDEIMNADVLLGTDAYYTVLRDGKEFKVKIPNDLINDLSDKTKKGAFIDMFPATKDYGAAEIVPKSMAEKGGMKVGDKIISVNGAPITFYHELQKALLDNAGKTVKVVVLNETNLKDLKIDAKKPVDGKNITISSTERELTIGVTDEGKIGFAANYSKNMFAKQEFTFGEAVPHGINKAVNVVTDNIRGFGKIFRGEVSPSKAVSGPVGMASFYGAVWNWERFWNITGMLSMVLAFMNLLPIPALDGGHVVFLIYEMIAGKAPSDKFMMVMQNIGTVLLLGLMAFALFNDFFKML